MPYSARENDNIIQIFGQFNGWKKALDVGTGAGAYEEILRPYVETIDGIEVWEPYIERFNLRERYDTLFEGDARELITQFEKKEYDVVIFGDVLEHMTREESMRLWQEASRIAHWGIISVPIIHYPQGAEFGNPYEVHVQDHLTVEDLQRDYGPFDDYLTYQTTGTFLKHFNGSRDED